MIYMTLYYEFFKIGLFAIGGGLASLPFLQKMVEKYGWISSDQLLDMIAISESTPGPIGINVATYVGYEVGGVVGGVVASLGEVTPSVIVITALAHSLRKYNDHPILQGAFSAIRPTVAGLIGAVAYSFGKVEIFHLDVLKAGNVIGGLNVIAFVIFITILFLMRRFNWHPVLFLAGAAVIGIVFKL